MLKPFADHLRLQRLVMMRFGLVGLTATAVHLGVALATQSRLHQPLLANLAGFLAAFGVSFLGHALWTFKLAAGWRRAAMRFFVVSGSSFLFSTVVLAACVSSRLLAPSLSLAISVVVVPVCNYAAARTWAFAHPPIASSDAAV